MKKIAILGSTGSIGTQTLEVVDAWPDVFSVTALAAGQNIDLLERQARKYRPSIISVKDEQDAKLLKERLCDVTRSMDRPMQILSGMEGLLAVATCEESELLVTAIVGMIGTRPTIAAIEAGKDIALSNKETLVCAGHLIMPLARKKGIHIYPVDSEHSAIAQCLRGEDPRQVDSLLLTGSGGPFFGKKREDLLNVTAENALRHPNWSMGRKITIDSATLVNKGLEIIEASWLFGVPESRITVVIQPQSIIHSMVQFNDGSVMAQLSVPDMKLSIQYALFGSKRAFLDQKCIDFSTLSSISFAAPDTDTFRGIDLARKAIREGGLMPTVLNAANEQAVALFLAGKIRFLDIYDLIENCMQDVKNIEDPDVEQILAAEAQVNERVESLTLSGRWHA